MEGGLSETTMSFPFALSQVGHCSCRPASSRTCSYPAELSFDCAFDCAGGDLVSAAIFAPVPEDWRMFWGKDFGKRGGQGRRNSLSSHCQQHKKE